MGIIPGIWWHSEGLNMHTCFFTNSRVNFCMGTLHFLYFVSVSLYIPDYIMHYTRNMFTSMQFIVSSTRPVIPASRSVRLVELRISVSWLRSLIQNVASSCDPAVINGLQVEMCISTYTDHYNGQYNYTWVGAVGENRRSMVVLEGRRMRTHTPSSTWCGSRRARWSRSCKISIM